MRYRRVVTGDEGPGMTGREQFQVSSSKSLILLVDFIGSINAVGLQEIHKILREG